MTAKTIPEPTSITTSCASALWRAYRLLLEIARRKQETADGGEAGNPKSAAADSRTGADAK